MLALFTVSIFVSAALLFLVQPMFARQLLPLLGGSPAVWNTAMVFYQAALLAGYAYAHASTTRLGVKRQAAWHLGLLLLPFTVLPIAIPGGWMPPSESSPIPWLLALMTVAVGLPFFVVSSSAPVLQKWFAALSHRDTADPYFLYVASNAGSLLALLSYPLWFEPNLRLAQQSAVWTWGYGMLVLLFFGCACMVWRSPPSQLIPAATAPLAAPLTRNRRLRWVLLAFVPSSLMLGVTSYFSTEIAVIPLFWVVPLAIYLLTFMLAFARRELLPQALAARALPILMVALVLMLNMLATRPIGGVMALHLTVFFMVALLCHGRLAADRPHAAHLTEFYLWLAVGGVCGGLFNALVAPLSFDSIAEYPVMLALASWLALPAITAPVNESPSRLPPRVQDWLWPAVLAAGTFGIASLLDKAGFGSDVAVLALLFGGAALICFFFSRRPVRFALGIGGLLLAGGWGPNQEGRVLHAERSFFGVHRVLHDPIGGYHSLVHGTTLHGRQSLSPERKAEALTYYHRSGPIGDVLRLYGQSPSARIAVVGLGAGSLGSYAVPGQEWTYFEIDPVVAKIARDERYFTFLRESRGNIRVVLGDARQTLAGERDGKFDLMILDAYSSDAIPVHLVTREALAMYRRKLAPDGRLAFHMSNIHLHLEPAFANLARDAGLTALTRNDTTLAPEEVAAGKSPSNWLVMAQGDEELAALARSPHWRPSQDDIRQPVWTDDYSSLLSVMRWR